MCWNKDISINTFMFSCFALVFIYISNTYTRYKVPFFDSPFRYILFFSFVIMQLLEYFIWNYLKNPRINRFLSKVGLFLVLLQFFLLIFATQKEYHIPLLMYYVFIVGLFFIYKHTYSPFDFRTTVSPNGHLSWEWARFEGYEKLFLLGFLSFYAFPYIFSVMPNNMGYLLLFSYVVCYVLLKEDNTYGSVWCWVFNFIMLKYLIDILIVLPFYEYNGLC